MSRQPPMAQRAPAAILETLAAQVMAADPDDAMSVRNIQVTLEELAVALSAADPAALLPGAEAAIAALERGMAGGDGALAPALDRVSEAVAAMQEAAARVARWPAARPPPAAGSAGRALVLPEWGDEKTLRDFLAAQRGALDELEGTILGMERGDEAERASFRRKLHTLKGEAGVLGLVDLERVAHALEDLVERAPPSTELVDRLLKVRDWMARALASYAAMRLPDPGHEAVVAAWLSPPGPGAAAGPPPAPPAPVAPAVPAERVSRDPETVGLFGEFLTESGDGIASVDETLMNVERDGATPEAVNALFRVFHTIKGTAGFLELEPVVALAHTTETTLNRCREGALRLEGSVIDVVFDATAEMRRLLDGVRAAVEGGTAFPGAGDLSPLLRRLEAAARPSDVALALRAQARAEKEQTREPVPDGAVRLKETIKVDLERVDRLVEMIGELVVVESMVVNAPEIGGRSSVPVRDMLGQLAKVTRDLQDVGMRMRMVPVAGVFQKMARMVRDLSRKSGKQVRLVTAGEGTEMDRSMVEQIADPLVHMIRNAMDHGLETPPERAAGGKPEAGVLRLSASHEGGSVVIELSDDGRGLDRERILHKAIEKGLIGSAEGMADADVDALIFAPGFSTAARVTEISGRGVGMDVVKRNVEAMRGRVLIRSTPGRGTDFRMVLPLTLAIIDGMLVASGDERYIIPTLSIVESIQPDRKMLATVAGRGEMLNLRGEILPLLRLDRLFQVAGAEADPTEALVVVVEGAGRRLGILVDEVVAQQQVVIKTIGAGLARTPFVSGAAILSDGRVGLILNVEEIAGLAQRGAARGPARAATEARGAVAG